MFAFRLAFRNVVSRKSSFVIILFVAFTICILVVSNAIFDGTGSGIETAFVRSFTGDIVVRPVSSEPLSLFGDETPGIGELSEIPQLIPYKEIKAVTDSLPGAVQSVPQLTGQVILSVQGKKIPIIVFGVDAVSYVRVMDGITVNQGVPFHSGERGIMFSQSMLKNIHDQTGISLSVGDSVQLVTNDGLSLTVRSERISAVYHYPMESDVLSRIALVDPPTFRDLMGMDSFSAVSPANITASEQNLLQLDGSIDDLFESTQDVPAVPVTGNTVPQNAGIPDSVPVSAAVQTDGASTVWNYIIIRAAADQNPSGMIKTLNRRFKENGWEVLAVNWRAAAGLSALYMYWLRLVFNIGVLIILAAGFIVVNNTLVISALGRIPETGTLRAIGGGRRFVAVEFLSETLILMLTAGIAGCLLGLFCNFILKSIHITFSNVYLVQLFGGKTLLTTVTSANILHSMLLSVLLAGIGWLYPAYILLKTSPACAMREVR